MTQLNLRELETAKIKALIYDEICKLEAAKANITGLEQELARRRNAPSTQRVEPILQKETADAVSDTQNIVS